MCIPNPSESGKGGKFIPCQRYNELWNKYALLQEKIERLKSQLRNEKGTSDE